MFRFIGRTGLYLLALGFLHGCVTHPTVQQPPQPSAPRVLYEPVDWSSVEGWQADQIPQAWSAFLNSCRVLGTKAEWINVCAAASASS